MSYEIIKGVRIRNEESNPQDNGVYLLSASSNLSPRRYEWWRCTTLTVTLKTKGHRAFEIELMKAYESGEFHTGAENRYSRAVQRLQYLREYKNDYDWKPRDIDDDKDRERINANRSTEAFDNMLYRALLTRDSRLRYVVAKNTQSRFGVENYVFRVYPRTIRYITDIKKAKRFRHKEEAQDIIDNIDADKTFFTVKEIIP